MNSPWLVACSLPFWGTDVRLSVCPSQSGYWNKHQAFRKDIFRLTSRHMRFLYFCLRFELRTMHVISFVCVLQFWMLFVLYAHVCYICVCLCVCILDSFFFQMKYVLIYGPSAYIINSCILQALGRLHQDMLYNNENKESADRRTRRREDSQEEWKYARNRWERKEQQIEGY